jgi:hypothetical protein
MISMVSAYSTNGKTTLPAPSRYGVKPAKLAPPCPEIRAAEHRRYTQSALSCCLVDQGFLLWQMYQSRRGVREPGSDSR